MKLPIPLPSYPVPESNAAFSGVQDRVAVVEPSRINLHSCWSFVHVPVVLFTLMKPQCGALSPLFACLILREIEKFCLCIFLASSRDVDTSKEVEGIENKISHIFQYIVVGPVSYLEPWLIMS